MKCSPVCLEALMIPKPGHIFDRDGEWRGLADFVEDQRPEVTLGVVSGRRRQGKTYLLRALSEATGGFFFEAVEATEAESIRMFGAALARHAGSPADFSFATWADALTYLFSLDRGQPVPLIIDEFPFLVSASPSLASLLRREIASRGPSPGAGGRRPALSFLPPTPPLGALLASHPSLL